MVKFLKVTIVVFTIIFVIALLKIVLRGELETITLATFLDFVIYVLPLSAVTSLFLCKMDSKGA